MPTIDIPDIWTPSAENIKALPLALRRYIEVLQNSDKQNLGASNYWMQETIDVYKKEIDRLSALLREAGIDPSKKD